MLGREHPAAAGAGDLAGVVMAAWLIWRRDRLRLSAWVVVIALLPTSLAEATATAYPTDAIRVAFANAAAANPAELALRGPVFAPTVGGLLAWTIGSSGVLVTGLVNLLLVIRHTRVEEHDGRRDVLASSVVGRHAPLAATWLVLLTGDLLITVLAAAGMTTQGLPVAGSLGRRRRGGPGGPAAGDPATACVIALRSLARRHNPWEHPALAPAGSGR